MMKTVCLIALILGFLTLPLAAQLPAPSNVPSSSTTVNPPSAMGQGAATASASHQETVQLVTCIVQTLTMVLGFIFVVLQFRKYIAEITKTHDWNRRKSSQEACYEFLQSKVQDDWMAIHKSVIEDNVTYDQLDKAQQAAMLRVIYYFENLGISLKNNIVDVDIIWDYFGAVWPLCYESAKSLVARYRQIAKDDMVFEHFVKYAEEFEARNRQIDAKKRAAGSLPGKPKISG